jgi:protein-S-isoprenylcysteine O-methyltransferase Ste14
MAGEGARHIPANQDNSSPSPELRGLLQTEEGRGQVLAAWKELSELHRHEDTLLTNRLQAFVVSTAVLVTAFSQFRDADLRSLSIRVLIAVVGFSLSLVTLYVLWRTSRASEWYLGVLLEFDQLLFPPELQPYSRRRLEMPLRIPLNRIQGLWIPAAVAVVWLVLVGLTFALPSKP